MSLKTVYQTVHDLEALGEVDVLDLGTGSVRGRPQRGARASPPRLHQSAAASRRPSASSSTACKVPGRYRNDFTVDDVQVIFRGRCVCVFVVHAIRFPSRQPKGAMPRCPTRWNPDPRQPEGRVRGGEPGQPPVPLLRAEGRRGGSPRTSPRSSARSPRVRPATRSVTSTSSPRSATLRPVSRSARARTT